MDKNNLTYIYGGPQPKQFVFKLQIGKESHALSFAPSGWELTMLAWMRNEKYYGLIRTYSVPLKFVKDGAKLLRKQFYTYGIEAKAELVIDILKPETWGYKEYYRGEIDFSQFNDSDLFVEVNIAEGGLSKLVKAYENVKYEIQLTGPDVVKVMLDPVKLTDEGGLMINGGVPGNIGNNTGFTLGTSVEDLPENSKVKSLYTAPGYHRLNNGDAGNDFFFLASTDSDLKLKGTISGIAANTSDIYSFPFSIGFSVNGFSEFHEIYNDVVPGGRGKKKEFEFDYEKTLSVAKGSKVYLIFKNNGDPNNVGLNDETQIYAGNIDARFTSETPATPCYALRPADLFKRLVQKIIGRANSINNVYGAVSSLLSKNYKDHVITCGDSIRGFENSATDGTYNGPVIKTSLFEFFQHCNSLYNVGLGVEFYDGKYNVVIEKKSYFYNQSMSITDVGEVKDFQLNPATQFIYNQIDIGYDNQTYDDLNGRDEVHARQHYKAPITQVTNKLNLISPYRADPYGIEFTRINLSGKNTTDSSSDNDVFCIVIENIAGENHPKKSGYSSVTGVLSPETYYNLDITPKKNLYRHSDYLAGIYDKTYLNGNEEYQYINFESADKNVDLVTVLADATDPQRSVSEKSNIAIRGLGNGLFLPYEVTFTTKLPRNIAELINLKKNGYIQFWWQGKPYKGFILEASTNPVNNEAKQYKLLLTVQNNLVNLIR